MVSFGLVTIALLLVLAWFFFPRSSLVIAISWIIILHNLSFGEALPDGRNSLLSVVLVTFLLASVIWDVRELMRNIGEKRKMDAQILTQNKP